MQVIRYYIVVLKKQIVAMRYVITVEKMEISVQVEDSVVENIYCDLHGKQTGFREAWFKLRARDLNRYVYMHINCLL